MTKHQMMESVKSLFRSHIDPDKDEELKGTKIEMDDKVNKILKLMKDGNLGNQDGLPEEDMKNEPIHGLIKELYNHYHSLYGCYDNLTSKLRKQVVVDKEKETSSSSSSSDTDTDLEHSSKRKVIKKNGKLENNFEQVADSFKQELVATNAEVADLRGKLADASTEKETLKSEYLIALSNLQEVQKNIEDLRIEAQRLNDENSKLLTKNESINSKLHHAGKLEVELNQKLEDLTKRLNDEQSKLLNENVDLKSNLDHANKLETVLDQQLKDLSKERDSLLQEKVRTAERMEVEVADLRNACTAIGEEKNSLALKLSEFSNEFMKREEAIQSLTVKTNQLQEKLEERELELSDLKKMHEVYVDEASSCIKSSEEQVSGLEEEVVSLCNKNSGIEEEIGSKISEAKHLAEENLGFQAQILNLEKALKEKTDEISSLLMKLEAVESEGIAKASQFQEKLGDKELEFSKFKLRHEVSEREASSHIKSSEEKVGFLEQEVEFLCKTKREMEDAMESKISETTQLVEENLGLQARIAGLEKMLEEKGDELSSLLKRLEDIESQSFAKVENMTAQVNDLKEDLSRKSANQKQLLKEMEGLLGQVKRLELELDSEQNQRREVEEVLESKNSEIGEMRQEKEGLQNSVFELEKTLTERGDELSLLQKQLEDLGTEASTHDLALVAEVKNLQIDLDSLRAQKEDLEDQLAQTSDDAASQIKASGDQVTLIMKELESLEIQKAELDLKLQKKTQDISEYLIQIENLKEELGLRSADEQRMLKEADGFKTQLNVMRLDAEGLSDQIHKLEKQIGIQNEEIGRLGLEKERLKDQVSEAEGKIRQREDELSAVRLKLQDEETHLSAQIVAFKNLRQELDSLLIAKSRLEVQLDQHKQELPECRANIEYYQKLLKEQEDSFNKTTESTDRKVSELEIMVDDLKRELYDKNEEVAAAIETLQMVEVKLRLSNQKVRVTEQLLTEKEESYQDMGNRLRQELRVLSEKVTSLSKIITANNEAHSRMITEISKAANETLAGLESLMRRLEEDYGVFENRISEICDEVRNVKSWITEAVREKERLQNEVSDLVKELEDRREEQVVLRESIGRLLEVKAKAEEGEKERLMKEVEKEEEVVALRERIGRLELRVKEDEREKERVMKEVEKKARELDRLMKEKEEGMLGLGEEKREAIRQLCIWIDYHSGRCDYYKDTLSKLMIVRSSRRVTDT